jgi:primosomal protein N' (replication factor Y)
MVRKCGTCGSDRIEQLGQGTERVEAYLKDRFPSARVARLDRDTADALEATLDGLRARKIDILVGTQMVTKGHDFPGVTLVGVLLADQGMGLPDFRASERTFQLVEQVAGRAGRAERPGRVIVQTYRPEHPAIGAARTHDYAGFAKGELESRQELDYPPYCRLAALRLDGAEAPGVVEAASLVAEAVRQATSRAPADARIQVLGPTEAPLARLKGRTRWQLFVKSANVRALRALARVAENVKLPRGVRLTVDVDPMSML